MYEKYNVIKIKRKIKSLYNKRKKYIFIQRGVSCLRLSGMQKRIIEMLKHADAFIFLP